MKKLLALSLAIIMMAAVFTGCSPKAAEPAPTEDKTSQDKTSETDAPADTAEPTTIAFIYIGSKTDGGYSQAQHSGTMAIEEYFGDKVKTLIAENVSEDKQTVKSTAINMIDEGASIVVGTSFGFMDGLEELSIEYPDVTFLHFAGNKMNDNNFGNYFGAMEEPRYLSGIIAGMQTKSNKLGYIAAFPYTEVMIGINAFALGAKSVNPDANVNVVYINSWSDPVNEQSAAESLLAQGCDVIAQHCNSAGPQLAAQNVGALAVGYNLDNSAIAPQSFLTAPIWYHEKYLIPTIEKIIAGEYKPESYYGTMKDGYLGLAPMTDLVTPEAKAKVEEVQAKIVAGEFPIFTGPIKDNAGNIVVPEGTSLDRAGIWSMNYLVEGVSGRDN